MRHFENGYINVLGFLFDILQDVRRLYCRCVVQIFWRVWEAPKGLVLRKVKINLCKESCLPRSQLDRATIFIVLGLN